MLELDDFGAAYGDLVALRRVPLRLASGELALVVGRNGAGRSTLLRALMGMLPRYGRYQLDGIDCLTRTPWQIAAMGVGYAPDTRDVFASLSTADNLRVGTPRATWCSTDALLDHMPRLRQRERVLAGRLSGGEQKLLSIARSALLAQRLWLLDEPFEGLAAEMVGQVETLMAHARDAGVAIMAVDRDPHRLAMRATQLLVIGSAEMQYCGPVEGQAARAALDEWLDTNAP